MINKFRREFNVGSAGYNLVKLPGKHIDTTLLLQDNAGYSFILEMIDKGIFEFTICIYDKEGGPDQKRHEYVLHCNKNSLRDLKRVIDKILK